MKQETKSIIDGIETGHHLAGYQTIPELTSEDVASLENLAFDQDLRENHKAATTFRRRFLLGLAALLFLGAVGYSGVRRENARVALVQSTSNDKEMSRVEEDLHQYTVERGKSLPEVGVANVSPFEVSIESADCDGLTTGLPQDILDILDDVTEAPTEASTQAPDEGGNKVDIDICNDEADIARDFFSNVGGALVGKELEDKDNAFNKVLQQLFLPIQWLTLLSHGTVVAAIIIAAVNAAWNLFCEGQDYESSSSLEAEEVAAIANDVVDQELTRMMGQKIFAQVSNLKDRAKDTTIFLNDFITIAEQLRGIALTAPGYIARQFFKNAATISILLLKGVQEEAANDQKCEKCCQAAGRRINDYRELYFNRAEQLERDFWTYKEELKGKKVHYKQENIWSCNGFVWTYPQVVASVKGRREHTVMASAWSSGGVRLTCPSRRAQENEAKEIMLERLDSKFDEMFQQFFPASWADWKSELQGKLEFDCTSP